MSMMGANDHEVLSKAEAVLAMSLGEDNRYVRAALNDLISKHRRLIGDFVGAQASAASALQIAASPTEVVLGKLRLSLATNDAGRTEDALKLIREAKDILAQFDAPKKLCLEVAEQMAIYASIVGKAEYASEAISFIARQGDLTEDELRSVLITGNWVKSNTWVRQRIDEAIAGCRIMADLVKADDTPLSTANSAFAEGLFELWDNLPSDRSFHRQAYDFWGRGSLAGYIRNAQWCSNAFTLTLDVYNLTEMEHAVRLLGMYADCLILIWKGKSSSGEVGLPFPTGYHGSGGWGYQVGLRGASGSTASHEAWATGKGTLLPMEVVSFLSREAKPFVLSGRLLVVPGPCVGCVGPSHGPFEQMFSGALKALPVSMGGSSKSLPFGLLPYSPDAPLHALFELAETESQRLSDLRKSLLRHNEALIRSVSAESATRIATEELEDAFQQLEEVHHRFGRKHSFATQSESCGGGATQFTAGGRYEPLFILQSLGYKLRVNSDVPQHTKERYQPKGDDSICLWLGPEDQLGICHHQFLRLTRSHPSQGRCLPIGKW